MDLVQVDVRLIQKVRKLFLFTRICEENNVVENIQRGQITSDLLGVYNYEI